MGFVGITMSPKVKFEVEGWECLRCGHQWIPRVMTETEPTICPKCKSPYWNKPRRDRVAEQRVKKPQVKGVKI